ncbi:MAG TPA: IgGFc-binding protein [Kofleriaceae bacterium]|nr:IgGFc-binding protein [Kofleriaceae bacterium]
MAHRLALASSIAVASLVACGPGARRDGSGNGDGSGGSDGSADCEITCSSDLHDVVDCNGNVITTCPSDLGCAAGSCIAPCDAASEDKSSIGCDYYSVDPDVITEGQGGCFAAYVANTWGAPVAISVERGGTQLALDGFARVPSGQGQGLTYAPLANGLLQPGQVAILFLAHTGLLGMACPSGITPAVTATDAAVHGTGLGQAFHITTSAPVVAYDIFPYGGGDSAATSATLLLPTSAWDTSYVAVDAFRKSTIVSEAQPFIEIVGQAAITNVTLRPTAAIAGGGGVGPATQGANVTYQVAAGQVLQLTQDAELNGTPITADQPVGVWGGATCLSVDVGDDACDSAHQEIPPVRALGDRYAAVRYRNRYANQEETVPWRMVGAVDGTTLAYLPSAPPGAPTTLAFGQIAEFDAPGPFVVSSQDGSHPFYMSAHMTGWSVVAGNSADHRGDPEFVNIVPPEQYLSSYTFFTDPTYSETNLVLTRERKNGAFADVSLDCSGTVTGWMPIDAADTIEYARLDLVTGNFQSVNGCNNGLHVATSTAPFGLVVWGWGSAATTGFFTQAVSYAYPAGASVKPINNVVIQ